MGVCERVCVWVRANPRGGTAALWRVGKEVSSPQVDAEDTTLGCVTEKDQTVSDVFNNKPTLTQGSTIHIYIYIYICVCVYVYIYFSPMGSDCTDFYS